MLIYNVNNNAHRYKNKHDETGGELKNMRFQYYDCFCGCTENELISTTTRHQNPFNIVRCKKCSTLRINPYMTEESTVFYYKEIYGRIKRKGRSAEALYEVQKIKKNSAELQQMLCGYVKTNESILDYGAGAGGRLDGFMQAGYKDLYIFDYDQKYMNFGLSKGFKPHAESNKYKLVILSHVIEHVNDPVLALNNLANLLAEGGLIYIEVPMYENTGNLINDFHLAHKYYFSRPSLIWLAKIAGFKVIEEYKNAIVVERGTPEKLNLEAETALVWKKTANKARRKDLMGRWTRAFK